MQQQQREFNELLNTLMESVEKYQEGESGEGNYLVAMNCLRSLHGFGGRIGDDFEVENRSLRSEVCVLENRLEGEYDWRANMSTFHDDPEWCKRCGSWEQEEEKIRETKRYGYLCLSCRDDLDCLSPEEIEEARIELERREEYMREHPEEE